MNPIEKHILKALKKGYTHEQIRQSLANKGYFPRYIDGYFTNIVRHLSNNNKLTFILSFLIILVITSLFLYTTQSIKTKSDMFQLILEADSLCKEGNYNQSIEMFNNYLLKNEPNSEIYFYLGWCFAKRDKNADAILYFNKALELDPKNPFIYFKLAQQQCVIDDFDSAEINFNKALELDPKNPLFSRKKDRCIAKE